jgi:hypothetical protein
MKKPPRTMTVILQIPKALQPALLEVSGKLCNSPEQYILDILQVGLNAHVGQFQAMMKADAPDWRNN